MQESLTNALKHAAPGPVAVRITHVDGELVIEVTSVFGSRPGPTAPGSGAGLVGMRERVALLGGTFDAGAEPGGTGDGGRGRGGGGTKIWRVRAQLPVTEGTMRQ
ncbi:hypothetical protein ACZ90_28555 [Streptomyces albus subsp. albus]|nr:hypothetical protein ACZ90_28555 [Streptomyces albus subsp. albus]